MSGLLPLMRKLKAMEAAIAITDPVSLTAEAFLIVPDRNAPLAKRQAAFENFPEVAGSLRMGDFREDAEVVRVRFTSYDADFDRGCEIAVAFYDAFKTAIDEERPAGERLDGTFDHLTIRSDGAVLQSFDGRPGWELSLEFQVFGTVS